MRIKAVGSVINTLLLNVVAFVSYLAISIPANFALGAPYIVLELIPNDFALGLPIFYYQFLIDGYIQHGSNAYNGILNLIIPGILVLIYYCGMWLWIMPAETLKQKQLQEKFRSYVRNQLYITGIPILFVALITSLGSVGNTMLFFNLLVLYVVNLVIYLKYDVLKHKAEQMKEEEFDDKVY